MQPAPQNAVAVSFVPLSPDARKSAAIVPQPPAVSVVVCTRDRLALLETCLESVRRQSYPRFDVLVVDNGAAYPARELCMRLGVLWVPAPVAGLTRARNIGSRAAGGDLVAFIDDDSVVEPGWLDALVAAFEAPGTAAVSGRVRYMRALADSRGMSEEDAVWDCARPAETFDRATPGWFALACFGGIGDGGNMAFRREVLLEGPGFDERIGRGRLLDSGDEHVLFANLMIRGLRIVHAPGAVVRHPSPPTPELQSERRCSDLRASISHLLFVWGEFPAHRGAVWRFLFRAVVRRLARRGGQGEGARQAITLSRWQSLKAVLGGVRLYWLAKAEWRTSGESVRSGRPARAPEFVESTSGPR